MFQRDKQESVSWVINASRVSESCGRQWAPHPAVPGNKNPPTLFSLRMWTFLYTLHRRGVAGAEEKFKQCAWI